MKVVLYYKYYPIKDGLEFAEQNRKVCEENELLGRIIIADDGINGTVSGKDEDVRVYMDWLHSVPGFEDVWFKEHEYDEVPFPKLQVRYRKELVTLGRGVLDTKKGGKHLSPKEWHEMMEKEDAVVLDTRNDIEYKTGHFKGALNPEIKFFRFLPEALDKYDDLKDKKVLMYCTGGIRCEVASVLLKEKGFKDVYQLDGGIYNYCKEYPDGFFEGTCFVFDDRVQVAFDSDGNAITDIPEDKVITHCDFCDCKTGRVVNDERVSERKLVVCCEECDTKNDVSRIRYGKAS